MSIFVALSGTQTNEVVTDLLLFYYALVTNKKLLP